MTVRCERHEGASLNDDILEGIYYYDLRSMVDQKDIGYAVGEPRLLNGAQRFDVRLYDLQASQSTER